MTTARDIIQKALLTVGAVGKGQTALAEDMNNAFDILNWMIAQWRVKRWVVYHLVDLSVRSTDAVKYTIGPGGDFNVSVRPDKLASAFVRLVQGLEDFSEEDFSDDFNTQLDGAVDYPLQVVESRELYNNFTVKRRIGRPYYVFLDTDFPLGNLYFFPRPTASVYSLHVSVKSVLPQFDNLSSEVNLPQEYFAALYYNLSIRLAPLYPHADIRADTVQFAKEALDVVRNANTQIPRLRLPDAVAGRGIYDIISNVTGV